MKKVTYALSISVSSYVINSKIALRLRAVSGAYDAGVAGGAAMARQIHFDHKSLPLKAQEATL